jgi:hypothetical protein
MRDRASVLATLEGLPLRAGLVVAGIVLAANVAGFVFRSSAVAERVASAATTAALVRATRTPREPIPEPEPEPLESDDESLAAVAGRPAAEPPGVPPPSTVPSTPSFLARVAAVMAKEPNVPRPTEIESAGASESAILDSKQTAVAAGTESAIPELTTPSPEPSQAAIVAAPEAQ